METKTLVLQQGADRRLRGGHVWIYSNEVDNKQSPLKDFEVGEQVRVVDAQGRPRGSAIINPNTLICGRIFSRDENQALDKSLIIHRLNIALSLREMNFTDPCYRLVYGDSDGLPGLVIDRFFDIFVIQISTAGMEKVQHHVIDALNKVFQPQAIVLRNDGKFRENEGLEAYVEVIQGQIGDVSPLRENGVNLVAPLLTGQKTGWFYDHRENRARMMGMVKDKKVLDLFSYVGGWGAQALAAGASEVACVDASAGALEIAVENAKLQNALPRLRAMQGDAFDLCKALVADKERFDVVIVDPPAFIMRKKDIRNGERAYSRINNFAMRLLKRGGVLVSASCSMHLETNSLVDILRTNSRELDRQGQIFAQGYQGADHPIHPAIPETEYLKAYFMRLLANE
ncbi:class I SAM-dependent rRNA methyltransferase [Marinobacterium sp. LSUCC0821]|jgi:23S rRNA (cytosine1962-C5)-methyltransferase|uniref:class I SAM-dependent rRNA methyltransferase n=1 Tax=Marinobacterium sp. LSUCC0821 TaxID=2668067 RepID=UPI00145150D7|nr:class I SAM-dependent rRNA methyltransferase [Marinobacterium sp. LSUCC0821]QJD71614.1 class I SAM-dependent rRNA methyltransferase [Marinobacterium sp. LSUCC0821]